MIATVTPNVSVDKLYEVNEFETGKVTRVMRCNATAGGKGLNVSRIVSILGEQVIATGFVGGHNGQYVEELLDKDGIQNNFIHVSGESRTCINVIDKVGKSTELLEKGVTVSGKNKDLLIENYRKILYGSSVVVLSGSIPPGCGSDFYARLIQVAKECKKPVILDTSGENLKAGVEACPTLIKPNSDEIKALSGMDVNSKKDAVCAAQKLHKRGIPYVVVSMGKDGAVLVCDDGIYDGISPDIKAVNTVGCGDSMVGAFAVSLARKYPVEMALQLALEVSAANAMCKQTGFFYSKDLKNINGTGIVNKIG